MGQDKESFDERPTETATGVPVHLGELEKVSRICRYLGCASDKQKWVVGRAHGRGMGAVKWQSRAWLKNMEHRSRNHLYSPKEGKYLAILCGMYEQAIRWLKENRTMR